MNAKIADKFTVLRSMNQPAGGHPAGSMQMLSGDPDVRDKPKVKLPDWMSVAHYLRSKDGKRTNPLPNYVGVNPASPEYCGPAYLGDAYSPFAVSDDPNRPSFQVPNIGLSDEAETRRLTDRVALRRSLDKMERAFDREGELGALDEFESQAVTLLTNPQMHLTSIKKRQPLVTAMVGTGGANSSLWLVALSKPVSRSSPASSAVRYAVG